jgi:hypothetical protein
MTRHATPYPLPTPQRRRIVQQLGHLARELDGEVEGRREFGSGVWQDTVTTELQRSAGTVRLVATLVLQGAMSTPRAGFWLAATRDYLKLVRRADLSGVIR